MVEHDNAVVGPFNGLSDKHFHGFLVFGKERPASLPSSGQAEGGPSTIHSSEGGIGRRIVNGLAEAL